MAPRLLMWNCFFIRKAFRTPGDANMKRGEAITSITTIKDTE
jgi:hypothetical protein